MVRPEKNFLRGWIPVQSGEVRALPNNGRGDCLFRAISHQIGGFMQAPALRQLAVQFIRDNLPDFVPHVISLGIDLVSDGDLPSVRTEEELVEGALQLLSQPHTMAGEECIAALSQAMQLQVTVYQPNQASICYGRGLGIVVRLLRQGQHYESILEWRPFGPRNSLASQEASATTTSDASADAAPPSESFNSSITEAECTESSNTRNIQGDSESNNIRSSNASTVSNRNFSDSEEVPPKTPPAVCKFIVCSICQARRGRYAIVPCGAFPICGMCIRRWYLERQINCLHCNQPVQGWEKIFNQLV